MRRREFLQLLTLIPLALRTQPGGDELPAAGLWFLTESQWQQLHAARQAQAPTAVRLITFKRRSFLDWLKEHLK